MSAQVAYRYERKLLPAYASVDEVLALIRRHPAVFREVYPERTVNNLYLDTPGKDYYLSHVSGLANRQKVRLRWYGQNHHKDSPALEYKIKRGAVSCKEVLPLPSLPESQDSALQLHNAAIACAGLPEEKRWDLRNLSPALLNRYRRLYFCSLVTGIRLTVDWQLEFATPTRTNGRSAIRLASVPPVIIELKYTPDQADQAEWITNALPFRLSRCSKYVLGMQETAALQ